MLDKIVARVKALLFSPKTEWESIKAEATDEMTIIKEYLVYLAAIPAVSSFIGYVLIGIMVPLYGYYRAPFFSGLIWAVLSIVLFIGGVYVAAMVINALAKNFDATPDMNAAFKLVAYSATPALLAGIFSIIPMLAPLSILGLYSIYLLYLGIPILMNCSKEKALPYTVISIIVMIVISAIIMALSGIFIGPKFPH